MDNEKVLSDGELLEETVETIETLNNTGESDNPSEEEAYMTALETEAVAETEEPPKKNAFMVLIDEIKVNFYENSIVRLLVSWIVISCYQFFTSEFEFHETEFFQSINLVTHIIFIAALYLVLTVLNNTLLDRILLFCSMLIYGTATLSQGDDFFFAIGTCIFMAIVVLYCIGDTSKVKVGKLPTIAIVAVLGIVFALFVGLLTSFKYLAFKTPTYDFGIFSQMFHYMKETFLPYTTCERDELLSHFAIHFSPIYYLLLPFYYIFPTPVTLLIGQGVVIASGLIPLYLLCKKYNLSNLAIILFSICYVFLPSMANGCFYYLHENKFLTALILWFIYGLEKKGWIFTIVTALLVMLVKEDAPIYIAVIGLYFIMSRRNIKKGAVTFAFAIVYFVAVSYFLNKYGEGTMDFRYNNFIYDGSGSLITVIKAIILNPIYTIRESFTQEKFTFVLQMLTPLAFMPLMSKKPSRVILFIPFILINLMSSWIYQYDINFQYTYGPVALLFYVMLLNFNDMSPKYRDKILIIAAVSSIFMASTFTYYRSEGFKAYKDDTEDGYIEVLEEALDLIPEDASVSATTFLTANLFDHREVYDWEYTKYNDDVEYLAIDLRPGYGPPLGSDGEEGQFDFNAYTSSPDYEIVTYTTDVILILKRVTPVN